MFCTIINDCQDYDAIGRQSTRVASLLGINPTFVGVTHELNINEEFTSAELEAAGCLIDVLDAAEGRKGVVLVNVAHRHGKGKKWPNGTPFGYFWYKETLVISSIDGLALSLVKKLGVAKEIHVMDVPTVMDHLAVKGVVSKEVSEHVKTTQFRSFDFTPRVGAYLVQGGEVPAEVMSVDEVIDAPLAVWFVDNFGNCKTTILPEEVGFKADSSLETEIGKLGCYARLKDVPDREKAVMIGSSGIEDKRFLEITVQGANASKILELSVGDIVV